MNDKNNQLPILFSSDQRVLSSFLNIPTLRLVIHVPVPVTRALSLMGETFSPFWVMWALILRWWNSSISEAEFNAY